MSSDNEEFKSALVKIDQFHNLINTTRKHVSRNLTGREVYIDFSRADSITNMTLSHLAEYDLVFAGFSSSKTCYVTNNIKSLGNPNFGKDTWSLNSEYIVFKDKYMKELLFDDNWGGGKFNFSTEEVIGKTISIKNNDGIGYVEGFIRCEVPRRGNDGGQGGSWSNVDYVYELESDEFDRNTKLLDLLQRGYSVYLKGE